MFAFDIDGTLCAPGGYVSERTARALDALGNAPDVVLAIVTGRPPRMFPEELRRLPVGLTVFLHGALTSYSQHGLKEAVEPLDRVAVERLVERLSSYDDGVAFALEGTAGVSRSRGFLVHPLDPLTLGAQADFDSTAVGEVLKAIVQRRDALVPWSDLIDVTAAELNVIGSVADQIIEVVGRGVDKASALARAAGVGYGAGPEHVVFVGDGPSDVAALRWARLGLAPADAHPTAIEVADVVIGASSGEGVTVFVEEWLAGGPRLSGRDGKRWE